ncbi:hypothetical protein SFOMI_3704 [Sphingobium fuliginis]|uniref:Uncharacterized protein n=1 Tax=Sphingobium fuliginis (strain ATCC 27551) TaxID=336203 RepID=A0A292ZJV1_SPHSA|nr:hypothetical protein SFOMI_3704 [Sphingobium fuliginis]
MTRIWGDDRFYFNTNSEGWEADVFGEICVLLPARERGTLYAHKSLARI